MKAVVDKIENHAAIVLFGDEEIKVEIPMALLPDGTREGSILKFIIELDPAEEQTQREKISNLLDKLKKKNDDD